MTKYLRSAAIVAAALLGAACAAPHPKPAPVPAVPPPAAAPVAAAEAPAAAPAPVVAPQGRHHKFWGHVESIDAAAGSFVVKSRGGHMHTFRVASDAKFTKGGHMTAIAFSDLAKGAHVRVEYAGDVAVHVHVFVAK